MQIHRSGKVLSLVEAQSPNALSNVRRTHPDILHCVLSSSLNCRNTFISGKDGKEGHLPSKERKIVAFHVSNNLQNQNKAKQKPKTQRLASRNFF